MSGAPGNQKENGQYQLKRGEDMKANFLDLHAAADFLGPGAIEIDRYQTEITDIVRRRGIRRGFSRKRRLLRQRRPRRSSTHATFSRRYKRRHEWSAAFR